MKKFFAVLAFALVCLSAAPAFSQTCLDNHFGANGTGPSAPGIPCLTEFTYPYSGDYTKAHFTVTTSGLGDLLVECYWEINGASSPDADRYCFYDGTRATSHSGVITGLMPGGRGNYLISFASCGSNVTGQGKYGMNCARTDPNISIAPWGNAQSNGHTLVTQNPPAGTFTWTAYPGAGTQTCYQGHTCVLAMSSQWTAGAAPAFKVVTGISVDTHTCGTPANGVMSCPSTGVQVQYSQDNTEVPSPGQSNVSGSYILSSGTYAGDYFCQAGAGCFKGPFNDFILYTPSNSTATCSNNCHTLSVTMQGTDSSQTNVGSPHTVTFNFSVLAQPTFTPTPPASFPPIPGVSNYWAYLASYGRTLAQCQNDTACYGIQSANWMVQAQTTSPGQYFGGDNFSAGQSSNPLYGISGWNYDGTRVAYGIGDTLRDCVAENLCSMWQANHAYSQWQAIATITGSCVLVVSTAGTSGGSLPNCPAVGSTVLDGTATEVNVGFPAYWNLIAERVFDQYSDWQKIHSRYTTDQEFNRFTDGDWMHAQRNNATVNASTPDTRAVEYHLFPFFSPSGGWATSNQRIIQNAFAPETDTLRDREYEISALYNYWAMSGVTPVNSGVNELQRRIDAALADAQRILEYTPQDGGTFTIAGGLGAPGFDSGLVTESLIHYCAIQIHEGQACDTRIYVIVPKLLDWFYSNQFNLTGVDFATPYTWWTVPYGPQLCQIGGCTWNQSDLAMLYAPAYAWWGANCNNCNLPTSGVATWTAADQMFQNAFDNVSGTTKEFTQLYKWLPEYIGWRNGTLSGTDSLILPSHNSYLGSTTPTIEPYPQGEFPVAPAAVVSGNSATITWYGTKPLTTCTVKVSLGCTGTYSQSFNATNCSTAVAGSDNLVKNVATANGLAGGQYCFGMGGTASDGTQGFSAVDVLTGNQDFTFFIAGGGMLSITTTSPLPQCTTNSPCTDTINATGGSPNYSWSVTSGTLPTGMSLCPGYQGLACNLSGTPTVAGTSSFTVQVCDSTPTCVSKPFQVTVANAALSITSPPIMPPGTVGSASYTVSFSGAGGVSPYTWSIACTAGPCVSGQIGGLSMQASTGKYGDGSGGNGTPTTAGTYTVVVTITDSTMATAQRTYSPVLMKPGSSGATTSASGVTSVKGNTSRR